MRVPIAHTLAWPARLTVDDFALDLAQAGTLSFQAPDEGRFPALRVAREALRTGGGAPTILNAANEVAVAAFLDERVGFLDIVAVVEATLEAIPATAPASLDDVLDLDRAARERARGFCDAAVR
jgi:1-deoxy-D-xylulose-5-phosphate reductoisomerase